MRIQIDTFVKLNSIKQILWKYDIIYVEIPKESIDLVYNLFVNHISHVNPENTIEIFYYGVYYQWIKKNYEYAKKYYQMAIEHGNIDAMNNLALYYEKIEKNYELAKKYYLMAIDRGHIRSMYCLAQYYETIEKDYESAKKYYLMGSYVGDRACLYWINKQLKKRFYIFEALNIYDLLDSDNLTNLNDRLKDIHLFKKYTEKNIDLVNKALIRFCCPVCKSDGVDCVFFKCGHPICLDCYGSECGICKT